MVERLASPDHDEAPSLNRPEQFQKTRVSRPVYPNRPNYRDRESGARVLKRQSFTVELGFLVVVSWFQPVVFGSWWRLDFTLNADGRTVYESIYTIFVGGIEQILCRVDVYSTKLGTVRKLRSICRRNVKYLLNAHEVPHDVVRIPNIDGSAFNTNFTQVLRIAARANESNYLMAIGDQALRQLATSETRCTRYQHLNH
jgi:hypothetical protein